uniref:ATP synthase F0 subunit 8 n=1 Tax=Tomicus minor TaxID=55978 RepID=UPI0025520447|nr:ATP synthase F0 subunit 8 [Tomicus minor]WGH11777.1 ATP synthase F0 subunit 8 [Tomicus minor]
MPQMSPMNWMILFMLFSFIFILSMIINYFSFYYFSSPPKKNYLMSNMVNWKW